MAYFHETPNMYPNLNIPPNDQHLKLNKINENKYYFIAEIKKGELMGKKVKRHIIEQLRHIIEQLKGNQLMLKIIHILILIKKLIIKIPNLKLVIMLEFQNIKTFLLKDTLQTGLKKFL